MPIYSANRMGSMPVVEAAKGYGPEDIGRILYESEVNSQKIFEAALAADFAEVKARREGTMLESELTIFNERSIKSFVEGIKDTLQRWLKKIKGAIESAIDKISAYLLGDGKKFLDQFNKDWNSHGSRFKENIKNESIEYTWPKETRAAVSVIPKPEVFMKTVRAATTEALDKTDEVKKLLGGKTPSEYREHIFGEDNFEEKTIKSYNDADNFIKANGDLMRTGKKEIKELRDNSNIFTTSVSKICSDIKWVEGDKDDKNEVYMKNISIMASAYQIACSTITTVDIKLKKTEIKTVRAVLGKIHALAMKKVQANDESAMNFIAEAAIDEVESYLDGEPEAPSASDFEALGIE